jgi:hypothetical protein
MSNSNIEMLVLKCLKDEQYKNEFLANPKAMIEKEWGQTLSADTRVQIILADPNTITLVIPNLNMKEVKSLNDADLEKIAAGTGGSGQPTCGLGRHC